MGNKGSTNSSTSNNITNNTVNKNYLNSLNKQITNASTETLVKTAQGCSNSVSQSNMCDMSNMTVAGDFNLDGNQSNKATVNFSCALKQGATSKMGVEMMATMMNEMKALSGTEAGAQLNAAALASATQGFGSGSGNVNSTSNNNVTNNVTNDTVAHIENIFETNLKNSFTNETVQECIGKTVQSNTLSAKGANVGGNANIKCFQQNSIEAVVKCELFSEAVGETLQKTFQELGMKVETDNSTSSKSVASASSTSENVSTGPLQDFGTAISGIIGSIAGPMAAAYAAPFIVICCCCCCCIMLIAFMVMSGSSSQSQSNSNMQDYYPQSSQYGGTLKLLTSEYYSL